MASSFALSHFCTGSHHFPHRGLLVYSRPTAFANYWSLPCVVGRIDEVNQRRARLVLGWVTVFKTGKPSLYVTSHPGQLSLAIPRRVGKMSTGDDYGHRQGRNGEFCVTVGPVTRTADILTQSVIWRTWAVC